MSVSPPSAFLLRAIEDSLQFVYGGPKLLRTSKQLNDFAGIAVIRDRRNMKHVGQHKLGIAVQRIFLKQLVEDLPCFGAVFLEKILALLFEVLRALAPRAERSVKRQMTKQV